MFYTFKLLPQLKIGKLVSQIRETFSPKSLPRLRPELLDHRSCIAHLSAEDILKSAVIEEKKFKNIETEGSGPRSMNGLDLWYS